MIMGTDARLKGCACQRLMSPMTSDNICRLRKLMRPPGSMSGLPSWMNCNVDRNTPENGVNVVKAGYGNKEQTYERNTWWIDRLHYTPVFLEVAFAVDRRFAGRELGHMTLTNLLPCPLQATDGWGV